MGAREAEAGVVRGDPQGTKGVTAEEHPLPNKEGTTSKAMGKFSYTPYFFIADEKSGAILVDRS